MKKSIHCLYFTAQKFPKSPTFKIPVKGRELFLRDSLTLNQIGILPNQIISISIDLISLPEGFVCNISAISFVRPSLSHGLKQT